MVKKGNHIVSRAESPADVDEVVRMLDDEFVFGKKRSISFSYRFPAVFSESNLSNIYAVKTGNEIVSCASVKIRCWIADGYNFKLAMIGGVFTKPGMRGRGLATALLEGIAATMKNANIDISVLWARSSAFYERLGWEVIDNGLFGMLKNLRNKANEASINAGQISMKEIPIIERIRESFMKSRIVREPSDYFTIPLPVEKVEVFTAGKIPQESAYAVVGRCGNDGYVYEMTGNQSGFDILWSSIISAYENVYINDCSGSNTAEWLKQNWEICWKRQNLAMWKILSGRVSREAISKIYISFLDRV